VKLARLRSLTRDTTSSRSSSLAGLTYFTKASTTGMWMRSFTSDIGRFFSRRYSTRPTSK